MMKDIRFIHNYPFFFVILKKKIGALKKDISFFFKNKKYHKKFVIHPLTNQRIPIITDNILVDPNFGTGVVKVKNQKKKSF